MLNRQAGLYSILCVNMAECKTILIYKHRIFGKGILQQFVKCVNKSHTYLDLDERLPGLGSDKFHFVSHISC